tara:strand:- start:1579 stop:1779 length:201 start_codon:yes stop_codon:yes gene_type:complete
VKPFQKVILDFFFWVLGPKSSLIGSVEFWLQEIKKSVQKTLRNKKENLSNRFSGRSNIFKIYNQFS